MSVALSADRITPFSVKLRAMKFNALMLKGILTITVLALALAVSGCGSSGADLSSVDGSQPSASTSSTEDTSSDDSSSDECSDKAKTPSVSGSSSSKPKIGDSSGKPPCELVEKDIKVGTGPAAKDGDEVTVNYVGHNWSNNEEFDTSWGKDPFTFKLGEGGVIQGWDQGVVGMKKGGRRLLVIPPDLGYGAQGQGSIPANETLIFVVDLDKIG